MTSRVLSLGLILLATGPTWAEDELPEGITARAWAIADGRTGELLWGLKEDTPAKAASTTKMMCAWVVLRLAEADPNVWDQTVTYSKFAASTAGSSSRLRERESINVAECLYGLLLPSGNDAGNALAEHFNDGLRPPGGDMPKTTRSNIVAEMNCWAERLEMTRTVYRSPYGDGGTAEEFTTTPRDLLACFSTWRSKSATVSRRFEMVRRASAKLLLSVSESPAGVESPRAMGSKRGSIAKVSVIQGTPSESNFSN